VVQVEYGRVKRRGAFGNGQRVEAEAKKDYAGPLEINFASEFEGL
jgi:hypothetical protein